MTYEVTDDLPVEKMAAKKLKKEAMWYCIFQG